jgi:aspartate racemase
LVEQHIGRLGSVRQLLAGGDVLSSPHVLQALHELPNCRLINGYGPTENTTFTCCYPFPPEWDGRSAAPIGRPISNTQVYVLDQHLMPVPIGVRGELYAAGDGLAHGYLNSPGLTAQRFVPNPFSRRPAARMYRTGDQARFRQDGTLEFLGRLDDQVKINGFRLHLSEVEAALQRIPGFRQVAVTVTKPNGALKGLAAYVVAEDGVTAPELRQRAAEILPGYMIPAAFHLVPSLPLTPNGKIDRRALSALNPAPPLEVSRSITPAETPLQEGILRTWHDVLGRTDFGIDDNFFDLGGHSLLATRVISRLNQELHCNLSLATLFHAPTVRALAEHAPTQSRDDVPGPIPRRARRHARPPALESAP